MGLGGHGGHGGHGGGHVGLGHNGVRGVSRRGTRRKGGLLSCDSDGNNCHDWHHIGGRGGQNHTHLRGGGRSSWM